MRTLGPIVFGLVLVISICVVAFMSIFPSYTYRYRMTVEVQVDGKICSGSSVIQVRVTKQPQVLNQAVEMHAVSGEAAFVDLGEGRNVIALLASGPNARDLNYPSYIVQVAFGMPSGDDVRKLPMLRGSRSLSSDRLPAFVTFTNLSDPETARIVRPDEFSTVFGPDVRLKDVRLEMTDDPVTRMIERRFPWWNGPFPWLKPLGGGTYVDTRSSGFKWTKEMFKRDL